MPLSVEVYRSSAGSDRREALRVGLVNNMPDAALLATETQFARLLQAAAGALPIQLRFSYLPEVLRSSAATEQLRQTYWPIDALLGDGLDALIVTGAEPVTESLPEERYWERFTHLVDWAQTHTYSSIWSCLAAHAAAWHLDGIPRRRLAQKCCGLFTHSVLGQHPLMIGLGAALPTPQSRWNELAPDALRAAGYQLLSTSDAAGANIFCRQGRSQMIFFQGHPEYERATLLKEYRRDTERYLNARQPHYPALPIDYFSPQAVATLNAYQRHALSTAAAQRANFPYEAALAGVRDTWREGAVQIYSNWLSGVAAARIPAPARLRRGTLLQHPREDAYLHE